MIGRFSPTASQRMAITLLIVCASAVVMNLSRATFSGKNNWLFLNRNLLLAWIPLGAALLFRFLMSQKSLKFPRYFAFLALGGLWLAFFPNAPYMVTDFIHINGRDYFALTEGQWVFNREILLWYDLVMITLFIVAALMTGFWSLFLMQRSVREVSGRPISWIFSGFVLFVSSFGIYLGRFIRWNSWNLVTNPQELLTSVFGNFHGEALGFTLLFFAFLVLLYVSFYYWSFLSIRDEKLPEIK